MHRDADFRRVQVDLEIGDAIKKIGGAFDGSAVDALFVNGVRGEGRALGDGLADDGVCPSDRIAGGVEPSDETIVPHGAIPAAGKVVFARPDNFYWRLGNLRDVHGFDDKVGDGIGAPAEAAAKEGSVNLNFFCGKPGNLRGIGAINGFELRTGPDFATIGTEVDHTIERLHHSVSEVRNIVFGGNGFRSGGQSGCRIADLLRNDSGRGGLFGEISEHLRGRESCVSAVVPGNFEFIAAEFGGPETICNHSQARGDLLDGTDTFDLEGFGGVETYQLAAKDRRPGDKRKEHAGEADVQTELGCAIDF